MKKIEEIMLKEMKDQMEREFRRVLEGESKN